MMSVKSVLLFCGSSLCRKNNQRRTKFKNSIYLPGSFTFCFETEALNNRQKKQTRGLSVLFFIKNKIRLRPTIQKICSRDCS